MINHLTKRCCNSKFSLSLHQVHAAAGVSWDHQPASHLEPGVALRRMGPVWGTVVVPNPHVARERIKLLGYVMAMLCCFSWHVADPTVTVIWFTASGNPIVCEQMQPGCALLGKEDKGKQCRHWCRASHSWETNLCTTWLGSALCPTGSQQVFFRFVSVPHTICWPVNRICCCTLVFPVPSRHFSHIQLGL